METDTESQEPILHIRIHPLLFEILKESGRPFDRSVHQEAKRVLLQAMYEKQMLPQKKWGDVLAEILYGVIKVENEKNGK